jgi:hypothetical protein
MNYAARLAELEEQRQARERRGGRPPGHPWDHSCGGPVAPPGDDGRGGEPAANEDGEATGERRAR